PQDLGTLALFDVADGVTLTGQFASEQADYFQFQVLQAQPYLLNLQAMPAGNSLPAGNWLTITNTTTGATTPLLPRGQLPDPALQVNADGQIEVCCFLSPGAAYAIRIGSWAPGAAYQLQLANGSGIETPPPLTVGAGPAIRIRLLNNGNDVQPPPVVPPTITPPPNDAPLSRGSGPSGGPTGNAPTNGPPLSTVPGSVLLGLAAGPVG